MSAAAVTSFLKNTFQGYQPTSLPPIVSYIMPPQAGDIGDNVEMYVVTNRWHEERMTFGRNQGAWKANHFEVELYLAVAIDRDAADADVAFYTLLDAVQQQLRLLPLPTTLQDPTTAAVSQLVSIGERFTVEMGERRNLSDERLVRETSLVVSEIIEWFQS